VPKPIYYVFRKDRPVIPLDPLVELPFVLTCVAPAVPERERDRESTLTQVLNRKELSEHVVVPVRDLLVATFFVSSHILE
jgi:hypothetical protein